MELRRPLVRGVVCLLSVAALASFVAEYAAPASAAAPQPPADPAVSAYVEQMPTSGGNVSSAAAEAEYGRATAGPRSGGGGGASLPGLKSAPPTLVATLRKLATSPVYGAPTQRLPTDDAAVQALEPSGSGSFLSSATNAVGTATRNRLFGLLAAMVGISAATLGLATRRHRERMRDDLDR